MRCARKHYLTGFFVILLKTNRMKNILVILFLNLSACITTERSTTSNYLIIADKPTTASKETLQQIMGFDGDSIVAPTTFLVVKGDTYSNRVWRTTLILYYQSRVGTSWEAVDTFPLQGKYPQIQKIELPKYDSLVVWVALCKDLFVTRSYLLQGTLWTPR